MAFRRSLFYEIRLMKFPVGRFAEGLLESCGLTALAVVPLVWNNSGVRIFEPDKVFLLRSITVLAFAAGCVWLLERPREFRQALLRPPRHPMVVLWAATVVATLMATALSVAPGISFWGSYAREQGAYTELCCAAWFVLVLVGFRSPLHVRSLVSAVLLSSSPAALYAILQHFGQDPVVWSQDVHERVTGFAGNALFSAACLIMVVPLTVARLLESFGGQKERPAQDHSPPRSQRRRRLRAGPPPRSLRQLLPVAGYSVLLATQLLAIVFTQSRGAAIGLAAGGFLFLLLLCHLHRRRRLMVVGIGTAGILLASLIIFNLPSGPLARFHGTQYLGRFGQLFQAGGSGELRMMTYDSVLDAVAAHPARTLVGYGPETLGLILPLHYPPKYARLYGSGFEDRAHNETLHVLVTKGAIGLVAYMSFFALLCHSALWQLGMLQSQLERRAFAALLAGGALVGGILPYVLTSRFTLSGVGLGLGLVSGLIAYVVGRSLRSQQHSVPLPPHAMLLLAVFTAVVAHFVETQFAFAITVTRLYFWVFAALIVVVGTMETTPPPDRAAPTGIVVAAALGLVLSVLIFDFVTPFIVLSGSSRWTFFYLLASSAVMGAIIIRADSRLSGEGVRSSAIVFLLSLSIAGAYLFLQQQLFGSWRMPGNVGPAQLLAETIKLSHVVTVFYAWVFLLVTLAALLSALRDPLPAATTVAGRVAGAYLLVLIAVAAIAWRTNLASSRADIFSKLGARFQTQQRWDAAVQCHQEAVKLQPRQDYFLLRLSQALLQQAVAPGSNPQKRDECFQQALDAQSRARDLNPRDLNHRLNLARLQHTWAQLTEAPPDRQRHLDLANQLYAELLSLSPAHTGLWNEWALVAQTSPANVPDMQERFRRSLQLDPQYAATHFLMGYYALSSGNDRDARDSLLKGVELDPQDAEAWKALAMAHSRLGESAAAVQAALHALEIEPEDYVAHRLAARVLQEAGDFPRALTHAERALKGAPPTKRPAIEKMIDELRRQAGPGG